MRMKKKLVCAICIGLLGSVSFATFAMSGNDFGKKAQLSENVLPDKAAEVKAERLQKLDEEISQMEKDGITSSEEALEYRDKVSEKSWLENELGLTDYAELLQMALDTVEAACEDMRSSNEEDNYEGVDKETFDAYVEELCSLKERYQLVLDNNEYEDIEVVYNNYYDEFNKIITAYDSNNL